MPSLPSLPLPKGWKSNVRSAILHAVALAHRGMIASRAWCADSPLVRVQQAAEIDRLRADLSLVREEMRIKDARMASLGPSRRPRYPPEERMAILLLRAARGWTAAETARHMLVTAQTVARWFARLEDEGEDALVRVAEPVNKFPDFVRVVVQNVKKVAPQMGSVRISQILARAALHLSPSTVRRIAKSPPVEPEPEPKKPEPSTTPEKPEDAPKPRSVIARRVGHVWGIDLSLVPTSAGFWVPWFPFAVLQLWPFCWWCCVVVDHFSRCIVGVGVFPKEPTSAEVCALLDRLVAKNGSAPKYTVTDQGVHFRDEYRAWCVRRGVKPRWGALGKSGSIALVERVHRSLKGEAFPDGVVPLGAAAMRLAIDAYVGWFNEHRPHRALNGATPSEIATGVTPANQQPRIEPRARYPADAVCAAPRVPARVRRGVRLEVVVTHPENAPHLPIVELRRAA